MSPRRREPEERFKGKDDNWLFARRHAVLDRMSADSGKSAKFTQYARDDGYVVHTGTVVNHAVGRAIGRGRDDARIVTELTEELTVRGYAESEIEDAYRQHCEQRERAAIASESGDASFDVQDGEVVADGPTLDAAPVVTPAAPKARRQGRDKLWWVEVLRGMAARYGRAK